MSAPKARGRSWETQVATMLGGIRLGRPHEPDVVAPRCGLVIECKNLTRPGVPSAAVEKAKADAQRGPGKGLAWAVFVRRKNHRAFTVTVDGEYFLELLRDANRLA